MAKTAAPDSGGSQFFLCFLPTQFLDGKHTVFGRVVKGIDVLAKIQRRDPEKQASIEPDKILEAKVLRKRKPPVSTEDDDGEMTQILSGIEHRPGPIGQGKGTGKEERIRPIISLHGP